MTVPLEWPLAEAIETNRLILEPLRVDHATEMAPLLDDEGLHEFIGDHPATVDELRTRYARQVVGSSPGGAEGWLNWIVRERASAAAVGTVQATMYADAGRGFAEVAWVIATRYQRQGYATEAAVGMVDWLRCHGTVSLVAHVHPEHHGSIGVARRIGLMVTDVIVDGEVRWSANF